MSLSLIAVFIPILLMGGIVGRLFREFAVTLTIAILISMVDLAHHHADDVRLRAEAAARRGRAGEAAGPVLSRASERGFDGDAELLRPHACGVVLRHPRLTMLVFLGTVHPQRLSSTSTIPKGFFPQQDTGRIIGGIRADQSISFQSMRRKFRQFVDIVREDPAIENVVGLHRRLPDQLGLPVRHPEAARRAQGDAPTR